jgi:hypothetical protein
VLDRPLDFPLACRTVPAALAREYLAAVSQELAEYLQILVINVVLAFSAEPALRLFTKSAAAAPVSFDFHLIPQKTFDS